MAVTHASINAGKLAFNPLSVGVPVVWLDSKHLTQAGTVTAIVDRAGVSTVAISGGQEPGYSATNASYASAPTFDFTSGSPAVRVTGHGITTGAFTVVIVGDGTDNYWMQDANGTDFMGAGGGSGNKLQISCDAGTYLASSVVSSGVPGVYACVYNGASSKVYTSAKTASASGNAGTLQNLTGVRINVGNAASPSSGGRMAGSIRHFMIFKGALSQADIEYLLAGFGTESGLTIGA